MNQILDISGCSAGIDVGSITSKAALLKDGILMGTHVIPTGYNTKKAAERVFGELLESVSLAKSDVTRIFATGYGRNNVEFAHKAITEITCHAAGAHYQDNSIRSVIDIGGQDSKVIIVNHEGNVMNFVMNDKCAAGTGRFLEVMARALETDLDLFGQMASKAEEPVSISSLCTVFAESEVISLIAEGETRENIINGIHESIAARVCGMALRAGITGPVMMTGGVSLNSGVVRSLEHRLGTTIRTTEMAQVNGAIGAALIAAKKGTTFKLRRDDGKK